MDEADRRVEDEEPLHPPLVEKSRTEDMEYVAETLEDVRVWFLARGSDQRPRPERV